MKKVLKRIDRSFFEWNKSVKMKYISHCGPVTYGPRTCSGRGPGVGEPCTKSQNLFYKNKKKTFLFLIDLIELDELNTKDSRY